VSILDSIASIFTATRFDAPAAFSNQRTPSNPSEEVPQPLCASAGPSQFEPLGASALKAVLQSDSGGFRGLRIFGNEAIPLSVSTSVSSLSFGSIKVGSSSSLSFTISNNSDCPMNFSISGTPYGFSVSSTGGSISARSSQSISVTFSPSYEQSYSGYLNISAGGSSASVYLTGQGVKNNS